MARHYYLTRSGRLRRKGNTLYFEPSFEDDAPESVKEIPAFDDPLGGDASDDSHPDGIGANLGVGGMGELALEPPLREDSTLDEECLEPGVAGPPPALEAREKAGQSTGPAKVTGRRAIPVEDVDALWVFGELDLNARVLVFLSQHKVPAHFFNYYGFYAGSFYPREYLQAGYLLVKQVRHYSNRRQRLVIAQEFVRAGMHNIMRNLRYYSNRGVDLQTETESLQTEILQLDGVSEINELMGCEGRARSAYYQAFSRILRGDLEFTKRVRRPPDNAINALISFTNGLVYAAALSQIYRTQLDPTISFLHEPGARRFSLALDLAEVFKPILADRLIFKLLNNRQLGNSDFAQDLNCCYLNERGRKTVLKEWDARLHTTIEHRRLRRKVSYERLIRLECYKLVKHLTDVEPYVGFRAWW
jgi:CRISPR-associated protein Cas1